MPVVVIDKVFFTMSFDGQVAESSAVAFHTDADVAFGSHDLGLVGASALQGDVLGFVAEDGHASAPSVDLVEVVSDTVFAGSELHGVTRSDGVHSFGNAAHRIVFGLTAAGGTRSDVEVANVDFFGAELDAAGAFIGADADEVVLAFFFRELEGLVSAGVGHGNDFRQIFEGRGGRFGGEDAHHGVVGEFIPSAGGGDLQAHGVFGLEAVPDGVQVAGAFAGLDAGVFVVADDRGAGRVLFGAGQIVVGRAVAHIHQLEAVDGDAQTAAPEEVTEGTEDIGVIFLTAGHIQFFSHAVDGDVQSVVMFVDSGGINSDLEVEPLVNRDLEGGPSRAVRGEQIMVAVSLELGLVKLRIPETEPRISGGAAVFQPGGIDPQTIGVQRTAEPAGLDRIVEGVVGAPEAAAGSQRDVGVVTVFDNGAAAVVAVAVGPAVVADEASFIIRGEVFVNDHNVFVERNDAAFAGLHQGGSPGGGIDLRIHHGVAIDVVGGGAGLSFKVGFGHEAVFHIESPSPFVVVGLFANGILGVQEDAVPDVADSVNIAVPNVAEDGAVVVNVVRTLFLDDVFVASEGAAIEVVGHGLVAVRASIPSEGLDLAGGQEAVGDERAVLDVHRGAAGGLDAGGTNESAAVNVGLAAFGADVNVNVFQIEAARVNGGQSSREAVESAAPGVVAFDVHRVLDLDALEGDVSSKDGHADVIGLVAENDGLIAASADDGNASGLEEQEGTIGPTDVGSFADFGKHVGAGSHVNGVASSHIGESGLHVARIFEAVAGAGAIRRAVPALDGDAGGFQREFAAGIGIPAVHADVIVLVAVESAGVSLIDRRVLTGEVREISETGAGGDDQGGVLGAAFGSLDGDRHFLLESRTEVEFVPNGVHPAFSDGVSFAIFQGSFDRRAGDLRSDSVSLSVSEVVVRRSIGPHVRRQCKDQRQTKEFFHDFLLSFG